MVGSKISRAAGVCLGAVILCLLASNVFAESSKKSPPLQKSTSYGEYVANTYFDPNANTKDAYYEILRNKKSVYRGRATENGERFMIGTLYDDDSDAKLVTMGNDITGNGQPDLVVSEWSGGANCCLTFHIFEIGTRFRKIGDIDAEYGDQGPHFVHLTKGNGVQIQIYDWTFANWHADFVDSPAPKVILAYANGRYQMASDLMSTPRADMDAVAAQIAKIRDETKDLRGKWPDAAIPPELWGTMLDLIYSGHRIIAWQFEDMAWPKNVQGEESFTDDFIKQLKTSPYWIPIAALGS